MSWRVSVELDVSRGVLNFVEEKMSKGKEKIRKRGIIKLKRISSCSDANGVGHASELCVCYVRVRKSTAMPFEDYSGSRVG